MNDIELKDGERVNQLFSSDVKIIQNREVFSYSIDSVLLSRFPKLPNRGLIVDLCAGNGAVGLFASTRTKATIVGVEIQERLADMAERSIQLNSLSDRMSMITDDLKNLPHHFPGSKIDLILCNPPYFKVDEHSNLNESPHYLLARHEITTNLDQICQVAQRTLKSNGRLVMVHRPDRFLDIIETMKRYNLAPKRIQFVYPKVHKDANMLLIEAIKDGSRDGLKILPPLFIHEEDGSYTPEIHEIYYGNYSLYVCSSVCGWDPLYWLHHRYRAPYQNPQCWQRSQIYTSQTSCDLDLPGVFPRQKSCYVSGSTF